MLHNLCIICLQCRKIAGFGQCEGLILKYSKYKFKAVAFSEQNREMGSRFQGCEEHNNNIFATVLV